MKLALITLFVLSGVYVFAQTVDSTRTTSKTQVTTNPINRRNGYETYQTLNQIVGSGPYTMINTIDHRYEGLRGSPYFLPEWNKGQIEMETGKHYQDVPIKFNAYRQQLILLRPQVGNDSIIVNTSQVKSFQFGSSDGQFYLFRRYPAAKTGDETLKQGYFMVLYQGKSSLLKRVTKAFKQADYKNPYSSDIRYDEFQDTFSYYLLKADQTLTKVKLSDKALIEAFGDHKDELKAVAKQNNLTGKTEDEAIQIVKQYDSL